MKTYRLITLEPLEHYKLSLNGLPYALQREAGLPIPPTPENFAYVEELEQPTEEPAEGFEWSRELTAEAYGWTQTVAPAAPDPVWYSQPAWRIRSIAQLTPYGNGTLMDAITTTINSLTGDTAQQTIAREVFFGGHVLERKSPLLTTMAGVSGLGLTDDQLDELFQQANAIEV